MHCGIDMVYCARGELCDVNAVGFFWSAVYEQDKRCFHWAAFKDQLCLESYGRIYGRASALRNLLGAWILL